MLNVQGLQGRSAGTRRTRFGVAGLAAVAAMLGGAVFLAGCSAGSASSSAAEGTAAREALPSGQAMAAAPAAVPSAASGLSVGQQGRKPITTVQLAPGSDIIYNAQLTVRAQNVNSAASRATQIAQGVGGYISSENNSANPDHPSQATATITLKIPVTSYASTLSELATSLGTQLSLQQQAQDVTEQVADVNSQVASFEAAIAQLRALLSHAGSVNDLLNVQNQINQEETQLEALEAQQRALSHETSYATVTVTILARRPSPPSTTGRPRRRWAAAGRPAGAACGSRWTGRWPSSAPSHRSPSSRPSSLSLSSGAGAGCSAAGRPRSPPRRTTSRRGGAGAWPVPPRSHLPRRGRH